MKTGSLFLIGGGAAALVAGLFVANKKSSETTTAIERAVAGAGPGPQPTDQKQATSPSESIIPVAATPRGGAQVAIHATGYWPNVVGLTDEQRKMEGGTTDRKKRKIITLEQHLSDPAKYPYVSVAGDFTIWPDGQRISLSPWPTAIFRVVDTGGHFFGARKVFRVAGEEPLDIAVDSSKTPVPKHDVIATIFPGDTFGAKKGPQTVATSKFQNQTVVTGDVREQLADAIVDAYYAALEKGL